MTPDSLPGLLRSFRSQTVLVIGDTISDTNVMCKARGISAETPTVVLQEQERAETFGGAACVYRNLVALGAPAIFLTADHSGHIKTASMMQELESVKAPTTKARFWCDGYKMLQVDTFSPHPVIDPALKFSTLLPAAQKVVVADYRHGLISEVFAKQIVKLTEVPLFVASQVSQEKSNHHWYSGDSTQFVLNSRELEAAKSGVLGKEIVVTLGEQGSFRASAPTVPAIPITPKDTTGAGDAFLAAYALSNSLEFANLWAGLSCEVLGANPPTIERLTQYIQDAQ